MAASTQGGGGGLMTDINVTPLVDVVLVLLVLMMVTATAVAQRTIPVELPKAKSGEPAGAPRKPVVVAVDEGGRLFLGDDRTPVTEDAVRAQARASVAADADVSAVLAADGRARHDAVVHALELLRGERVTKIAIVVRAEAR